MKNCILNSEISDFQTNFIYVYDFLKLWTFFIEVVDESKEIASASYPQTIFTIGSIPKNAPEKIFIEDNSDFGDFDESNDEDPLDYY